MSPAKVPDSQPCRSPSSSPQSARRQREAGSTESVGAGAEAQGQRCRLPLPEGGPGFARKLSQDGVRPVGRYRGNAAIGLRPLSSQT